MCLQGSTVIGPRRDRETPAALRGPPRWMALLTMTRVLGATLAIALLLAHSVTDHDALLALITLLWTALSLLLLQRTQDATGHRSCGRWTPSPP